MCATHDYKVVLCQANCFLSLICFVALASADSCASHVVRLETFLYVGHDGVWLLVRFVVFEDFAVATDEELSEVPGDVAALELAVLSHITIDWVAVGSVHFALLEQWECHIVLLNKLLNCRTILWFLTTKLVAWESIDLQSFIMVLIINLLQLLVVAIGQSSERCNINKENGLLIASVLSNSIHTVSVQIVNFKLENTLRLLEGIITAGSCGVTASALIVCVSTTTHIYLFFILKITLQNRVNFLKLQFLMKNIFRFFLI